MQYFVVTSSGRFGPADVPTLQLWVSEGRITNDMFLEDSTGRTVPASQILQFPQSFGQPQFNNPSSPGPGTTFQSPPGMNLGNPGGYGQFNQGSYPGQPGGFAQYPRAGFSMDNGAAEFKNSIVFSVLSVLCCPVVFSILGIVYASKAKEKGHPQSQIAMGIAVFLLVVQGLLILGSIARH